MTFLFLHPPTIADPPDDYRVALYKRVETMGGPPFQGKLLKLPLDGSAENSEEGEALDRRWELDEIEASR